MTEADDDRRVAVVSGAARGLGRAVTERLVADGWNVVLVDLDPQVVETAQGLQGARGATLAVLVDVSDEASCAALPSEVAARWGRLDALINNAGVGGPPTPVHQTDPAEFDLVLRVNLRAPYLLARALVPLMLAERRGGGIVNIGSVLGQRAEAGSGAYSASKAGLALLGQSMALELAPHGIRVNTVAPGNMLTAMHEEYVHELARSRDLTYDEALVAVRASVPLGRHGTGADVAGTVAWLLSDDAGYVTGQTIPVNGGILLT